MTESSVSSSTSAASGPLRASHPESQAARPAAPAGATPRETAAGFSLRQARGLPMHKTAAPAKATQEAATDAVLPNASVAEFEELNQRYDTAAGYLPNNAEGDTRNAQKIEDGLQQDMTGYPPQVVQFQQRTAHLQGMLASLPEKQRQFYAGILATLNVAYQLDTHDDTRYALGQKMTELEDAIRGEATRVGNDPLARALAQFEPPMGEAWLGKEDRESLDELGRLRDDFLDAPDANEREAVFQEASDLKRQLQAKVSVAIIEHQRSATAQWKEANGEVDRILKEAEAQTDPARRYELIGRQLFQIDPGQDALKDKVVLAFTQRMHDSPALRDKLDTWHDQVSGPLNTYSVGAPKRYTDILKNLPPVSNDYLRDLSDQYNAVLQDASTKDESITPSARAMKLAGQILEGIERVLLGLTPLAPLADMLPSTLPPGVRMGLDYGSAYLGMLAGEGWGAIKEISLTGKAMSSGSREAEFADRSAGSSLVKTGARGLVESSATESSLSHEAKAAERALEQKTLDAGAPPADPALEAARAKMSGTAPHPVDNYAAADVHREDLVPGSAPGVLVDTKGGNYIELDDKLLPVRFDKDNNTWRVVDRDNALRPQYPVRLNEATHRWELHHDVGLPGGAKSPNPSAWRSSAC